MALISICLLVVVPLESTTLLTALGLRRWMGSTSASRNSQVMMSNLWMAPWALVPVCWHGISSSSSSSWFCDSLLDLFICHLLAIKGCITGQSVCYIHVVELRARQLGDDVPEICNLIIFFIIILIWHFSLAPNTCLLLPLLDGFDLHFTPGPFADILTTSMMSILLMKSVISTHLKVYQPAW